MPASADLRSMPAERIDGLNQGLRSNSRQGGRRLQKGTCTEYDVIVTPELNLRAVAALGTAGPWTEIIFGANKEYSSRYSPLKLLCIMFVPCVFLFKPRIQER